MQQDHYLKARLTIQEFLLPIARKSISPNNKYKRSSINFLSNNLEKRASYNIEANSLKRSQQFKKDPKLKTRLSDQLINTQANLPEIRVKAKTIEMKDNSNEENSQIPKKMSLKVFHKVEKAFSDRYNEKMEILKVNRLKQTKSYKFFSIKNIHSQAFESNPQPYVSQIKQKHLRKSGQFMFLQKHHINRLKDQFHIPQELQTQRFEEKSEDNRQIDLQLKNLIRFKFDSEMDFRKLMNRKKKIEKKTTVMEGWEHDHSIHRQGGPFFY